MRYFGIGLQRTGTTSLCGAFKRLGFVNSYHYLHPETLERKLREIKEPDTIFVNDLPIPALYRDLDSRFPGSRFVYTIRPDIDAWLASSEGLHKRMTEKGRPYPTYSQQYNKMTYGEPLFDEQVWRAAYYRHDEQVRNYFAHRPSEDFLVMDIFAGDGYELLIPWIGWENIKFPHKNSSGTPIIGV